MGLSYLSSITSHFLNVLHWMVFDLFFLRENENDLKFATNVANASGNVLLTHSKIITAGLEAFPTG